MKLKSNLKISTIMSIFLYSFCFLYFNNYVSADIYMFIDGEGGIHFTNVPTSSDYVLFVKERPDSYNLKINENRYDHIIKEASQRYDVPFSLLKAIIKVESGFNSKAVSRKGAVGLMQIMPENNKNLNVQDPYNPWENIMGGSCYFKKLLSKFEGKLPLALAAYNAGPTVVDKYKTIPPYEETENYVRKVMTYYYALKD